ncbi:MAG TPA: isoaspartyl peptidase/L-asparaginase [Dissulfurispiraceae bacterium]|nr:isoaspartyl peptidase/L-asparaginase [Dissulfurispiraceae bacterium]
MVARYGIVVHGGVGSPGEFSDGCEKACSEGLGLLESGRGALDAVIEAVRILEDDGRFNAGSGSVLRLDGRTRQMDAAVMDSWGRVGAVIAIEEVKNPVLAAREVLDTPHVALAGRGATLYARMRGLQELGPVPVRVVERFEKLRKLISSGRLGEDNPLWSGLDLKSLWNFEEVEPDEVFTFDTVGAVALDEQGVFAVAASTGGASPMMCGRVGDTPMIGCGFYAGPAGAVACTGIGEEIVRRMLARAVYDRLASGDDVQKACEPAVGLFPGKTAIGIISVSASGYAVISDREMASWARIVT